ncbi:MAG: hypothetical protein AAGE88_04670 [Actinomycetota bacterium]
MTSSTIDDATPADDTFDTAPLDTVSPDTAPLDAALGALQATAFSYGPGYANHGPMAAEALEHQGRPADIETFIAAYAPMLVEKEPTAVAMDDWVGFVRREVARLAPDAAALAGHGLLRLAHAVRAVERADTPVRRADLAEAVDYWSAGRGLAGATPSGRRSPAEAVTLIPRLRPSDTAGMLTRTLALAAADDEVQAVLASVAPPDDHQNFLDTLALASVDRYLANGDERSFVFIHGVTVPTMGSVLLPHLDRDGRNALCAALVGFVFYAVAGFDTEPERDGSTVEGPIDVTAPGVVDALAALAGATLDDHTIKFTDACLTLARRTGAREPLVAAAVRVAATSEAGTSVFDAIGGDGGADPRSDPEADTEVRPLRRRYPI